MAYHVAKASSAKQSLGNERRVLLSIYIKILQAKYQTSSHIVVMVTHGANTEHSQGEKETIRVSPSQTRNVRFCTSFSLLTANSQEFTSFVITMHLLCNLGPIFYYRQWLTLHKTYADVDMSLFGEIIQLFTFASQVSEKKIRRCLVLPWKQLKQMAIFKAPTLLSSTFCKEIRFKLCYVCQF
jgi:hypothetical protein